MEVYENGHLKDYNLFSILGEGEEVTAYLCDGKVVKIYKKSCPIFRLSISNCKQLINIETKRILLPKTMLLDINNNMIGYTMNYIEDIGAYSFKSLPKNKLKEELQLLMNDIEILSDNHVILGDLSHDNTVYNKGIYLIDPGRYKVGIEDNIVSYGKNVDIFDEYLLNIIKKQISVLYNNEKKKTIINNIKEYIYNMDDTILEYLINDMEFENIGELVKHKGKI